MQSSQKLNKRISIERPVEAKDTFGHRTQAWASVATVWAGIRPTGSNERLAAAQMQSGQTHVITTRWHDSLAMVDGSYRLVWGCRHFNIVGFPRNINEGGRWLVFDATEGGADGS